ncbi:MAG: adenosylcobinamide-phosphate synthase CbiB [Bacillota bacterium]
MMEEPFYIACLILIGAILLDLWIGDPRWLPHPVIQMGRLISLLERKWNRGTNRRLKGVLLTGTVVVTVYVVTFFFVSISYHIYYVAGVVMEICMISTTIAIKGLSSAGKNVKEPLAKGNLVRARKCLSMIVGRDTENLEESEIVRGTVETVSENTVDGITAPLFWALIGGAPLAMAYRAVNTLDSMVGYKNEQFIHFGWASAILDDIVNWLPARITALTMWFSSLFIRGSRLMDAWKITWSDAKKHPSPNSGWSEAMVAGLMGVQLGGVNYYKGRISERATMGTPTRKIEISDIDKAIRYMHGGWLGFLGLLVIALYIRQFL